ncbi:MAG: universal stress protein [Nitriliruptoraceae bacterium]
MTILVGYNASKESEGAIVEAAVAARARQVPLHILRLYVHEGSDSFQGVERELEEAPHLQEELDEIAAQLRESGVEVVTDLRHGLRAQAADTILDVADEIDAQMIVLGWRPRSRMTEAVLGGVARQVLRRTHRPVLSVPVGPHH